MAQARDIFTPVRIAEYRKVLHALAEKDEIHWGKQFEEFITRRVVKRVIKKEYEERVEERVLEPFDKDTHLYFLSGLKQDYGNQQAKISMAITTTMVANKGVCLFG